MLSNSLQYSRRGHVTWYKDIFVQKKNCRMHTGGDTHTGCIGCNGEIICSAWLLGFSVFFFQRPFSSALHSLYTTEHDNGTRFLLSRRSLLLVRTRFKNDERSHVWLLSQQVIQLDQIKIYLYIYSSLTSTIIQRKQKCVLIVLALWSFRIKV